MTDLFLERERELMKLNESLNSKISFDLKTPKVNWKPTATTTTKRTSSNQLNLNRVQAKNETIKSLPTKKCAKDSNTKKLYKSENISDLKTTLANNAHTIEKQCEKYEFERKPDDAVDDVNAHLQNNNNNCLNMFNEIRNFSDETATSIELNELNELNEMNEMKMNNADINNKRVSNLSLVPQNLLRRNVSSDGIIKFLKSKVTILQQELDLSYQENTKNVDALSKAIEQQKKVETTRNHATNQINSLNLQIQKLQQNETNLQLKLKESEIIQQSHRKECDDLKSKLKSANQMNSTYEIRLNKHQDDMECLRKNYHAVKAHEMDLQSALQHERTFYENQLKINQKQRNDLIAALKKHMLLLENLKRQNSCLAQAKCIQITETEFIKVLDWNNTNAK